MLTEISQRLLDWYALNARSLPWRGHPDPYAVWVSEIMLQQTRVEAVIPYFHRWMERFPTLTALAEAPEQAVLQAWEGLGYYSRARHLHQAAQRVLSDHQGVMPASAAELAKLPGIGRYTAGAIASMAFGQDEPALDGNIRRVLARLFNVDVPERSPEGERRLWDLAQANLPPGKAGDYNQAWMDLGSTVCTPRNPACLVCPLNAFCAARQLNLQAERPVKAEKKNVPHITVTAAVIQRNGQVLIAQRPANGLLGSMWEFPGGKLEPGESMAEGLQREIREELATEVEVGEAFGVYEHAYTHFQVTLHAFLCRLTGSEPQPLEAADLRWVEIEELKEFPMGKIDRQIARRLMK